MSPFSTEPVNYMNANDRRPKQAYLFRDIADRIQNLITRGNISPGDRLPSERQLAADLQVSRASVREAFRVLEQKDMVEIRRGKKGGAYVKSPSHKQLSEGMDILLQFDRLSLDQIAEYREAIEGGITAMASRKARPDDIRRLKYLLEVAHSFLGKGSSWVDEFIDADKAVHLCVAQIAGNPLFTQSLEATLGLRRYFCRFLRLHPSLMEANFQDLSDIVAAMENHQTEMAVCITRSHIARFNDEVV